MKSNFSFLAEKFPVLYQIGILTEKYLYSDANSCLIKLGMLGETIVNLMLKLDGINPPKIENTHANQNPTFKKRRTFAT